MRKNLFVKLLVKKINSIKAVQVLYFSLLVSFFFLGYFYAKLEYLEKAKNEQALIANTNTYNQDDARQAAAPAITNDTIKGWATQIGLNKDKFNTCLDSRKYESTVTTDQADGDKAGVQGTPTFFVNGIMTVGAIPYASFKSQIDKILNGEQQTGEVVDIGTGSLPPLGNKDAQVVIVEFSDLECPFSHKFANETLPQLKKDYMDTGKVAFYLRHFPLTQLHFNATTYALAVECANEQGKAWEMHDKIIKSQGQ